jgi:hypothetical protein
MVQPAGKLPAMLKTLGGFDIRELSSQQLNLEDEFLEFYGGTK